MKSWHPATYENQKRIWIAEKKDEERLKKEKEAAAQLAKEMEQCVCVSWCGFGGGVWSRLFGRSIDQRPLRHTHNTTHDSRRQQDPV